MDYIDIEIRNHITCRRYISRYYGNASITDADLDKINERIFDDVKKETANQILSYDMTDAKMEILGRRVDIFSDKKQLGLLHTGAVHVYDINNI